MKAVYREFDGLLIPKYNRTETVGSGRARSGVLPIIGGLTDRGGRETVRETRTIDINTTIYNQTAAATWTEAQRWRAKLGKLGRLIRLKTDGTRQHTTARLVAMEAVNNHEGLRTILAIKLTFEVVADWIGFEAENWRLNAGYRLNEGNKLNQTRTYQLAAGGGSIVIDYGGDVDERELTLAVSAGASAVPSGLRITMTSGCALQFLGTIAAGTTLTIDSGIKTVRSGAIDGYNALAFLSTHRVSSWLLLEPGRNVIGITAAAPVTVTVIYKERFA